MRRVSIILVLCICPISFVNAQSASEIRAYIDKYSEIALNQQKEYGIPATITLAQGILESGAGTSKLTLNTNNHFGIKAIGGWGGDYYLAWDDEPVKSKFRVYASAEESFRDHSKVLANSPRYSYLFKKSIYDYRGWAVGLQSAGYATAPNYAKALIGYIEAFSLYKINGGVKLKPGKTVIINEMVIVSAPGDSQEQTLEESEEEQEVSRLVSRFVVQVNDVRCSILGPGQSLSQMCQKYDIPMNKIFEYNEVASERQIKEGAIVYLARKKNRFNGMQDVYRVKEGDSLYSISQMYGIRLNSLARMNKRQTFSQVTVGEKIRLR